MFVAVGVVWFHAGWNASPSMSSVFIWALLTLMPLFVGGGVERAFGLQADLGGSRGNQFYHGHASDEGLRGMQ